jgi:hypothetical protein
MAINSNRSKGVITAFLSTFPGAIRIWLYALIRSNVIKILASAGLKEKSWMWNTGYLSNKVMGLKRPPPQSRYSPFFLDTMWKGLAYWFEDDRQIPFLVASSNSSFAILNLPGLRRRNAFLCDWLSFSANEILNVTNTACCEHVSLWFSNIDKRL